MSVLLTLEFPFQAEEFYHAWKTPPKSEQRNSYIQIKRKDDSRGVERVGRYNILETLCLDNNVTLNMLKLLIKNRHFLPLN